MTIPTIPSPPAGYVVQPSDLQNLAYAATFALTRPMTKIIDNIGGQSIGTSFAVVQFSDYIFDTDGMWGEFLAGQNTGFEGGNGNWVAGANCSIANTSAQAHTGANSLALTSTAAGNMNAGSALGANITTLGMPCNPGDLIGTSAWFRSAVSARSVNAGVDFYTAAGSSLSTIRGTSVSDSTSAWTQATATVTAPATAAFCRASPQVVATGAANEVHYVDDVLLAPHVDRLIVQTPGWYRVSYGINVGTVGGVYNTAVGSTTGANNPLGPGVASAKYWGGYCDGVAAQVGWAAATGDWPFYLYQGDYLQVYVQAAATGSSTGTTANGLAAGGSYFGLELVSI